MTQIFFYMIRSILTSWGHTQRKKLKSNDQNIYKHQQNNAKKYSLFYTCRYRICDDVTNRFANSSHLTLTPQYLNFLQYLDQSFSGINSVLNSQTPFKLQRFIFFRRCLVFFPKNFKILSYKKCLNYTKLQMTHLILQT